MNHERYVGLLEKENEALLSWKQQALESMKEWDLVVEFLSSTSSITPKFEGTWAQEVLRRLKEHQTIKQAIR